jgi:hypothetical protein
MVEISITGFFGSFTGINSYSKTEPLRATAHQLIKHRAKGLGTHEKQKSHGYQPSTPTSNQKATRCN